MFTETFLLRKESLRMPVQLRRELLESLPICQDALLMTTDRPAFSVPQISELLHVSTRTIERRLAENGISARSFSTITDDNSLVLKKILHLSFNISFMDYISSCSSFHASHCVLDPVPFGNCISSNNGCPFS